MLDEATKAVVALYGRTDSVLTFHPAIDVKISSWILCGNDANIQAVSSRNTFGVAFPLVLGHQLGV